MFGSTHTASYTLINRVHLTVTGEGSRGAYIGVGIYHDASARSKGNLSSEKQMLDQDLMMVTSTEFDTFFQDSVLDNNAVSPLKQAYAWLKTQTNVLGQNWTTGTTDV